MTNFFIAFGKFKVIELFLCINAFSQLLTAIGHAHFTVVSEAGACACICV